jgi:hypothetical protein
MRATILIVVGLLVAAVHLTLGLSGVLGTASWVSGVGIGLLVAGVGNHIRIFSRR